MVNFSPTGSSNPGSYTRVFVASADWNLEWAFHYKKNLTGYYYFIIRLRALFGDFLLSLKSLLVLLGLHTSHLLTTSILRGILSYGRSPQRTNN